MRTTFFALIALSISSLALGAPVERVTAAAEDANRGDLRTSPSLPITGLWLLFNF